MNNSSDKICSSPKLKVKKQLPESKQLLPKQYKQLSPHDKLPEPNNPLENPDFEYEYIQDKLYSEEMFNALYLSFENPNQASNAFQYIQMIQHERMLMESALLLDEEKTEEEQTSTPTLVSPIEQEEPNIEVANANPEPIKAHKVKPEVKKKITTVKPNDKGNDNTAKVLKSIYLANAGKKGNSKPGTPINLALKSNKITKNPNTEPDPTICVILTTTIGKRNR